MSEQNVPVAEPKSYSADSIQVLEGLEAVRKEDDAIKDPVARKEYASEASPPGANCRTSRRPPPWVSSCAVGPRKYWVP